MGFYFLINLHTMDFKNRKKEHIVYALMYNSKPIYVGYCMDLKKRELAHKRLKKFDYAIIIKKYDNKLDALLAENSIIRFISLFNEGEFLNGLYQDMVKGKEFREATLLIKKEMEVNNG